jgi:phage-related protein (TIGR01555 family)
MATTKRAAKMMEARARKATAEALKLQTGANTNAVKDMYMNQASNTGFATTSQVNGGTYVPYRISLDYLTLLYMYRGSWVVRALIDTIPEDMLKAFPTIVSKVTPEQITDFNRVIQKTVTLQKMIEGLKWGRLFGGAIAIIILSGESQKDLAQPLVLEDVELDSYRGLIIVDRWSGVSPSSKLISNLDNPAEYGLPAHYQVTTETSQNFKVHHSRVLRFTGRDLPLFEKQIQTYWGMSEVEAIFQELQRRDFVDAGIADLVSRAHVFAVKEPMLAQLLSGVGLTQQQYNDYILRTRAVSESITTNGLLTIGEGGEFYAHSFAFAGLRDLHDAMMENLSGASGIPMQRWGKSDTGLGNSGEGALQVYYDQTDQKRAHELGPIIDKLIPIICMSTWGQVPDDLDYHFAPIRTMTSKERAELGKNQLDPVFDAFDKGLIGRQTSLREMAQLSKENGLFTNVTPDMIEDADDELLSPDLALGAGDGTDPTEKPELEKSAGNGAKDFLPAWVRRWFPRVDAPTT